MVKVDNISYNQINENLSKRLGQIKEKLNVQSVFDILTYYCNVTNKSLTPKKDEEYQERCKRIIDNINKNIINPLGYYQHSLINYNKQFNVFGNENPFKIGLDEYYSYINSDTKKENIEDYDNLHGTITPVEQYLKLMFLSNRIAKFTLAFEEYDIQNTININTSTDYSDEYLKRLKNKYSKFYNNSYIDFSKSKRDVYINFMNIYKKYYAKKISREELENTEEYKNVLKYITDLTSEQKNIFITPDSLFRNFTFQTLRNRLYILKNQLKNISLTTWLDTIKEIKENNNLSDSEKEKKIQDFKSLFRITQFNDRNLGDKDIKNDAYDTCICFIYKGYNIPFVVHTTKDELNDILSEYSFSIEEGEIDMKHFIDIDNAEIIDTYTEFSFKPIIPYKYTDAQLNDIEEYNQNISLNDKNYFLKKSFVEYTNAMTSNLNKLYRSYYKK